MCEINTKPDRHTCEDYMNPVVVCATAAYISWGKKEIHNPPLLLSVPFSFSHFLQLPNADFLYGLNRQLTATSPCKSYTVCLRLAPYRRALPLPHCVFLFHWQLHTQMWLRWYESPLFLMQQSTPPVLLCFTSSLILSSTPWTSYFLSISFCCYHPCVFLSSKSSLLAPMGRISLSLLLRSFLSLSSSLSSLSPSHSGCLIG